MMECRNTQNLDELLREIGLKLGWVIERIGLRQNALAREVSLATGSKCHASDISRILNGQRLTQIKKVLPVIIRLGGFKSRDELEEFIGMVVRAITLSDGQIGQIVKLRMAVYKACDDVNLPDHTSEEQDDADLISDAERIVRETMDKIADETVKRLRNKRHIP